MIGDGLQVDALELFKAEIRAEDLPVRIECVKHVDVIAHALGKDNAISVLVPLISDCVKGIFCSDDDELLLSFAKNLPKLVPYLPVESGPTALIGPLEFLANQDETVIREAAVESLGKLSRISKSVCDDACYPALLRLFKGTLFEWCLHVFVAEWFSPKLSACGLAHFVYPSVGAEARAQIRMLYIGCANDETPMVKRAAASHLHKLLPVMEKEFVISEVVPVYQMFATDDTQEAVRCSCVASSVALCELLNESEINMHARDTITALATDKSWRVRLAMAKVLGRLCQSLGRESMVSHLLAPMMAMMQDQEPDVRKAAVSSLHETAGLLSPEEVAVAIVPLFSVIGKDPVQQVRSALSACIGPLAKTLGNDFTLTHLLPLLMESIKDDYPTIRFNATGSIGSICEVLGNDPQYQSTITSLVSLMHTLSQDANWRTRLAVLEQIPILCKLLGKEVFEQKLESLLLSFFGDSVHAIRAAVTQEIGKVVLLIGEEWAVNHFANKVLSLYSETNSYSSRIAILQTLPKLKAVMKNADDVKRLLFPPLEKGCRDLVPNVRFVACEVIAEMFPKNLDALRPSLDTLATDVDIDVRYFAQRAVIEANK